MIELELAPYEEVLADSTSVEYQTLANALQQKPLYHQLLTYQHLRQKYQLVVNSYNTGTGKTKAALLRLLDLAEDWKRDPYTPTNVLFIAPTNELLRQHEDDIQEFVDINSLPYVVLRLDAATIKELAQKHLGEKFLRQGDRLHQMLQDPGSVLTDQNGQHLPGRRPSIVVINPDIFYYALYGLGNPHDQRVLFRDFVMRFQYIVIDEFHYYNAKQLANFLFFLALSKTWKCFDDGRKVCLLSATPNSHVRQYLERLHLDIAYIEPGNEPQELPRTAALAPIQLRVWSAEAFEQGIVDLAQQEKSQILTQLQAGKHGAFISSALWRINAMYGFYGGKNNVLLGRLTGAESTAWRTTHKLAPLLMATPTVDIGYNFVRPGKQSQSLDFLLFDARYADECIQRIGRAGRVLGKKISNQYSQVCAIVPDDLATALQKCAGTVLTRSDFSNLVNSVLPQKNGVYAYIQSGAIAEAFLPLYGYTQSLPAAEKERGEQLYQAIKEVYGTTSKQSFHTLTCNTRRYRKLTSHIASILKEDREQRFTFGRSSAIMLTMDSQPTYPLEDLDRITEAETMQAEKKLRSNFGKKVEVVERRKAEIEEYFVTHARFNFRDNYQPSLALAYDPHGLLATAEYTWYSTLHIAQNYEASWFEPDQPDYRKHCEQAGISKDQSPVEVCCEIHRGRPQRLRLYFSLNTVALNKHAWEDRYCSTLAATDGFVVYSDDGPVPMEVNRLFEQQYIAFYAVPATGPEALALQKLCKTTALFTNSLHIDFDQEGRQDYLLVLGSSALLIACERTLLQTKHIAKRAAARGSHLFDWTEEC
jgi:CRISPR-associated endonuclease/helicase Cas3